MNFEFFPLRFEFTARESLFFPPGKAANILRGALGTVFRKIACVPECDDSRTCAIRHTCPYAKLFAPESDGEGPSGMADSPRPFVFRARHLDGHTIQPGRQFWFDLNVFTLDPDALAYFVLTFAALAREGLGPRRGRADLQRVRRLAVSDSPELIVFDTGTQFMVGAVEPVSLSLIPSAAPIDRIRVEFLTPTELKHDHQIAQRPEFPILFGRIRDRLSTLRRLYGAGPLELDYQASTQQAAAIRMVSCQVHREEARRHSSRTGQSHSIGGFTGIVEYEGELAPFVPWLEAARWVGVGRQAVWGKGELHITGGAGQMDSLP